MKPSDSLTNSAPFIPDNSFAQRVTAQRERQLADLAALIDQIRRESVSDIAAAHARVRRVDQANARVIQTLGATTGQDLGRDWEAWLKWWAEERGYGYEPPPLPTRQDLTLDQSKPTYYSNSHYSCFAADTPVTTLAGPRPIESIAVGDQVLTQNPRSGALSYHPVIDAVHNKPDKLFKIDLGQGAIKATGIHRFWKAGHGWVMARDLKPGDVVRTLGGVATVKSVEPAGVEPVYNLKVLQAESFFAGASSLLVHDNSEVQPVTRPFDALPGLAAAAARARNPGNSRTDRAPLPGTLSRVPEIHDSRGKGGGCHGERAIELIPGASRNALPRGFHRRPHGRRTLASVLLAPR